ncbi:hypothetical protein N5P37_003543, partial [Trichoderma harzianum]
QNWDIVSHNANLAPQALSLIHPQRRRWLEESPVKLRSGRRLVPSILLFSYIGHLSPGSVMSFANPTGDPQHKKDLQWCMVHTARDGFVGAAISSYQAVASTETKAGAVSTLPPASPEGIAL